MSEFIDGIQRCLTVYGPSYLEGAGRTLLISLVGTFFGCVIGFAVGIVQSIPSAKNDLLWKRIIIAVAKAIMKIYVQVFRGTPMMVQAMFIFYGARMVFDIHMGMWSAAFFIVSINTGAYMAETVRGGILSIDPWTDRGRKSNRNDTFSNDDNRHPAAGVPQYYTADRQQFYHQYQGYFRTFCYQRYRTVLCS